MVPVLILGESGVGKEVVARALHAASNRKGLFVGVNCGAIPESLVESQLFGHVRGAFSGAVRDEPGFVRSADRGTLFLDEIADLPRASQAALLRVLQEREVIPIGTTRPVKVDLRFVAATHQSLATLVARGSFRHDLFARLAGYTLTVCPLRERKEDIGMLVPSILRKLDAERAPRVTFTPAAGRALFAHDWPFNVRELEHALAAAMVLAPDLRIDANHLGASVLGEIEMTDAPSDREPPGADDPIRLQLLEQLAMHGGHVPTVARAMGKARMQVHRWLKRYGIDPGAYRRRDLS
jgi:DNA-binding NtrC family response regulator